MADGRRRYVRVYYSIRSDERFAEVYADDRRLAAWLRLLIEADAVWPEPASIPVTTHRPSLAALVRCGLVEHASKGCIRIHGLDRERNARASSGRNAAALRWHPDSVSEPNANRTEQNRTEQEHEQSARTEVSYPIADATRDSLDTYYELTGTRPWGRRSGEWLHGLEETHGLVRLEAALRAAARESTEKLLHRAAATLERAADQRPVASPVPVEEQKAQLRKAAADQRAREEAAEARVAEYRRTHDHNTGVRTDGGIDP